MSSASSFTISNADENHRNLDLIPSSSNSSCSDSSNSSPDRQQNQGYALLNGKSRRKKRSFIPENKKDSIYWSQRSKNNISAQRSRVKRRVNDLVLETKLTQLSNENQILRAKIDMLAKKFGHLTNDQETMESSRNLLNENEKLNAVDAKKTSPSEEDNLLDQSTNSQPSSVPVRWRFKLFSSGSNS